jgi:hypothetical protein
MIVNVYVDPNKKLELEVRVDIPCSEAIPKRAPLKEVEGGIYHYGENELGIVSFGFESFGHKPGDGGLWSSNSAAVQRDLGIDTIEICLIPKEGWRMASAMKIETAKFILPEGYVIVPDERFGGFQIIKN